MLMIYLANTEKGVIRCPYVGDLGPPWVWKVYEHVSDEMDF